jgi:hypothetical protein
MEEAQTQRPFGKLVEGELSWKDYIASLSPEALALQRQYDRERVKRWYQENKERKREYHQENKARFAEQRRIYREENIEKMRERERQRYEQTKHIRNAQHRCSICGGSFTTSKRATHLKTLKHQKALTEQGGQCAAQSSQVC